MEVKSTSFKNNGNIPSKYTCDGDNVNPPLIIEDIPENTKSIAIIMDDPDAPSETFTHWIVWNIKPEGDKLTIEENSKPGVEGINDFNKTGYGGPCPPSGIHRYFFRIYALNSELNLEENSGRVELENQIKKHRIEESVLMGTYKRV